MHAVLFDQGAPVFMTSAAPGAPDKLAVLARGYLSPAGQARAALRSAASAAWRRCRPLRPRARR